MCENFHGANRRFYSKNSSLYITIFWYQDLSDIEAKIMLSTTHCKSVHIFPCQPKGDVAVFPYSPEDDSCIVFQFFSFERTVNSDEHYCPVMIVPKFDRYIHGEAKVYFHVTYTDNCNLFFFIGLYPK